MLRPICYHWLLAGTLTANESFSFVLPFDVQLIHAAAMASNDSDATLKIGSSSDDDAYMVATAIGDSGSLTEFDRDDFVSDQYPHISAGTTIVVTLDYDGASGTAGQNVEICVTLTEG